jgi:hypothetical protein
MFILARVSASEYILMLLLAVAALRASPEGLSPVKLLDVFPSLSVKQRNAALPIRVRNCALS